MEEEEADAVVVVGARRTSVHRTLGSKQQLSILLLLAVASGARGDPKSPSIFPALSGRCRRLRSR